MYLECFMLISEVLDSDDSMGACYVERTTDCDSHWLEE